MISSIDVEVEAVKLAVRRVGEAFVSGNLEAFVGSFSEDAVCMLPNRAPAIGRDAWRQALKGMFESMSLSEFQSHSEEIVIADDWAFEWHNESFVVANKQTGVSNKSYHKGVFIFHIQTDGSWKIARYISNPNPAPQG